MSKKRKTKKQKIASEHRKIIAADAHIQEAEKHEHTPVTYSLDVKPKKEKAVEVTPKEIKSTSNYIKKDIRKILYATVGILVFDVALFVMLNSHLLKLNILGY